MPESRLTSFRNSDSVRVAPRRPTRRGAVAKAPLSTMAWLRADAPVSAVPGSPAAQLGRDADARRQAALAQLATSLALPDLLGQAERLVAHALPADSCVVLRWNSATGLFVRPRLMEAPGVPVFAAQNGLRGCDVLAQRDVGPGRLAVARINARQQHWGVIRAHAANPRAFQVDGFEFLHEVARVLGTAIMRWELEHVVFDLSRRLLVAENAERQRIAQELHDSTTQDVVAAMLLLDELRGAAPVLGARRVTQLDDAIALLEKCAHDLRTLAFEQQPPRLDERGLPGAVQSYVDGFAARTGLSAAVELEKDWPPCEPVVEMTLFRVLQEALGNVYRHARSPSVTVRLWRNQSQVVLEIADAGIGLPPAVLPPGRGAPCGVGLAAMRDRLRQVGGEFELTSTPGRGTTVRAIAPIAGTTPD